MQTKDFSDQETSRLNDSFNTGNSKNKRKPEKKREKHTWLLLLWVSSHRFVHVREFLVIFLGCEERDQIKWKQLEKVQEIAVEREERDSVWNRVKRRHGFLFNGVSSFFENWAEVGLGFLFVSSVWLIIWLCFCNNIF